MRRSRWWPLAAIGMAHLMVVLDTTVMLIALPSAQRSLGMTAAARQWVLTAYTLAFAGMLLLAGRLADRFGARRVLMAGVAGFALAAAAGGLATGGATLVAARALQGAFGALVVASTRTLLALTYTEPGERARAFGLFAATLTGGLALGLMLGGVLTTYASWRWCLLFNVPLSAVALVGAVRVLPNPARGDAGRIDLPSAVLVAGGLAALVYGLGAAGTAAWGAWTVVGPLAAGAALLGAFTLRQPRLASPLLPLRVLRERSRAGALLAQVFNSLGTLGLLLIGTYELQDVLRVPAIVAAAAFVPFAAVTAASAGALAVPLMSRLPPRALVTAGLALSAAGLAPLAWLTPASGYWPLLLLAEVLEGLGTGICSPPAMHTALRGVAGADTGVASAVTSAASQVGSAVGTALLNTLAVAATASYAAAGALPATGADATVHGFAVATGWGAAILAVAALVVGIAIDAPAVGRPVAPAAR